MSYSWAEIRSGLAEEQTLQRSSSECCLCVPPWDMSHVDSQCLGSKLNSDFICTCLRSLMCARHTGNGGHSGSVRKRNTQDRSLGYRQKLQRLSQCPNFAPEVETWCLKVIRGPGVVEQTPVLAASEPPSMRGGMTSLRDPVTMI